MARRSVLHGLEPQRSRGARLDVALVVLALHLAQASEQLRRRVVGGRVGSTRHRVFVYATLGVRCGVIDVARASGRASCDIRYIRLVLLVMPRPPWKAEHGVEAVLARWLASSWVKPCFCGRRDAGGGLRAVRARAPRSSHRASSGRCASAGSSGSTPTRRGRSRRRAPGGTWSSPRRRPAARASASTCPSCRPCVDDPDARAIYLYPTKALARDQEAGLRELMEAAGVGVGAVVYDGDTPGDARRAARERAGIVLTNPDMLHTGILPHHTSWARTMQHLRYVVIDELHTYKGVFGSHVANVLRRLLRVARFHGSTPQVIGATATIGNPREHAARMFGVARTTSSSLDESGAPRGQRRFFLFNPPVVNSELGIRASYVKQAVMLAADLVRARVPTIVFGQSRNSVEVMLRYLRDAVATRSERTDKGAGIDPSRIMAYRGGYLPEQRRDIERRLRDGEILCVVATNALELGIDIGELDAVVCAGYPGSIAATWQRLGRAGRRGEQSIGVLVASSAPLDQYLAREPAYFLGSPVEEARVDPDNVEILVQHLKCAAFELPFKRGEAFGSLGGGGDRAGARLPRAPPRGARVGGHVPLGGGRLPGERRLAAERGLGQRRHHRRRARSRRSRSSTGARRTRCCTSRPSTSTTASAGRSSASTTRTTRRSCAASSPTTGRRDDVRRGRASSRRARRGASCRARGRAAGARSRSSRRWSATRRSSSTRTRTRATATCACPRCRCTRRRSGSPCPRRSATSLPEGRAAAIDGLRGVGLALETVATLALMCDPRDLGTTLGDAGAGRGGRRGASRGRCAAGSSRGTARRSSSTSTCRAAPAWPSASGSSATCCSRARFASSRVARARAAAPPASARARRRARRVALGAASLGRPDRVIS